MPDGVGVTIDGSRRPADAVPIRQQPKISQSFQSGSIKFLPLGLIQLCMDGGGEGLRESQRILKNSEGSLRKGDGAGSNPMARILMDLVGAPEHPLTSNALN